MATLNQQETKALLEIADFLSVLYEDSHKPPKDRKYVHPAEGIEEALKAARDKVRTVVTMKGHYPK